MKKLVACRFKKHTKGWQKAMLFLFLVSFLPAGIEHVQQFFAPVDRYFIYEKGNEVSIVWGNEVGKKLQLHSNSEYKQPIQMKWFDTLICDNKRYGTQFWEDFMTPWITPKNEIWEYEKHVFTGEEKNCILCWVVIWTTSRGYQKYLQYCTKNFTIKK